MNKIGAKSIFLSSIVVELNGGGGGFLEEVLRYGIYSCARIFKELYCLLINQYSANFVSSNVAGFFFLHIWFP